MSLLYNREIALYISYLNIFNREEKNFRKKGGRKIPYYLNKQLVVFVFINQSLQLNIPLINSILNKRIQHQKVYSVLSKRSVSTWSTAKNNSRLR